MIWNDLQQVLIDIKAIVSFRNTANFDRVLLLLVDILNTVQIPSEL